ncbi:VOC family protein [Ferdinandcohnia quinoae]|uniref:VOC family protein n=1 Tax=Fredinandcohnia quinoae TaxID=2918902 RepID=A0AAW5E728_9BACI|nr:VOC family protein [Fredinandcohnia sp. SECRCQ15]MCH1625806.1 VOC family protein [Fredinandcohnia sp. SECRCQ15]
MMNQASPYFMFNGNAREALDFYKELFEGEILNVQTYGNADYPTPPEAENLIINAQFKKDNLFFMVSDTFPGSTVEIGNNISLVLELGSEEEIQKIYSRLSEKGTVEMELQDTFWGAKYAKVKDPFGITWDLNYTKS